jgi:hypothetical protein
LTLGLLAAVFAVNFLDRQYLVLVPRPAFHASCGNELR